jgi:hypothetical protein
MVSPHAASGASSIPPPLPCAADRERTDADLIESYADLWRTMLAQKNGVSTADVDAAVTVTEKSIRRAEQGAWLVVRYRFSLDWATVDVRDELVVRVDSRRPHARSLGVALDHWLSASEVATAAETASAPTSLARLPIGIHLTFPSRAAARAALAGPSHATFDERRVRIELAWPSDPAPHLFMTGVTPHAQKGDTCVYVHLDLVTGVVVRKDFVCGIAM